jgi:hypothetical protein
MAILLSSLLFSAAHMQGFVCETMLKGNYRVAALFPEHFQSFTMAFQFFFFNNFFGTLSQLYSEA